MTCTARELAEYLGTELEGNPSLVVSKVASPENAGPEDLIYVDSARHLERAAHSAARCAIVALEMPLPGKTPPPPPPPPPPPLPMTM